MFRIFIAAWTLATLLAVAFVWRSWELKEAYEPSRIRVTLSIVNEPAIMQEVPAEIGPSQLSFLRMAVSCVLAVLSALVGNAVRLLSYRDLLQWLGGPVRISIFGGYLLLGAGCISVSRDLCPVNFSFHFLIWIFGFLLVYGLVVLYLAAWRDAVEGRSGAFALLSRIGIEALAWISGGIGVLGVLFALVGKVLAIFVR